MLIYSPFCLQHCSHSEHNAYFTLRCISVNIRNCRATVRSFGKHIWKCTSNLRWISFFFSQAIIGKCICVWSVLILKIRGAQQWISSRLFVDGNKQLFTASLSFVIGPNERTPILLFLARLVIGRKRLGGPGWVRYTVRIPGCIIRALTFLLYFRPWFPL